VRADGARALVGEIRAVANVVRHESSPSSAGPIVVSGMLADQLAKELAGGARPGAVLAAAGAPTAAEVLVRVIAGDPTEDDDAVVSDADRRGIPLVVVQLWPQAEWTRPFVLTPFVVECRAGEGFPLDEIADRIVEASERDAELASRVPILRHAVEKGIVRRAVVRATALAVLSRSRVRPRVTLEQVRMVSRLASLEDSTASSASATTSSLGRTAGAVLVSGVAFRELARATRRVLPGPLADGLVAGAATWAIARAARALDARRPG
jgi:hypothetical protein